MTSKANHNKIAGGLTRGMTNAKSALANSTKETKDMVTNAAYAAGSGHCLRSHQCIEKASSAIEDCKRRWYNPLFLEDYQSEDFDMPKLVVIADEDIRKGNELCEGAIGWLNTRRIPEIIFMYEEFVPNSAIRFSPRPICGSAYYRHPFEPDLYLQVKDYLKICKRDQLTELKNIAYLLGATAAVSRSTRKRAWLEPWVLQETFMSSRNSQESMLEATPRKRSTQSALRTKHSALL